MLVLSVLFVWITGAGVIIPPMTVIIHVR